MRAFFLSIFVSNELNGWGDQGRARDLTSGWRPRCAGGAAGRRSWTGERSRSATAKTACTFWSWPRGRRGRPTWRPISRIRSCVFDAFVECHLGYAINEVVEEIFRLDERTSVLRAGGTRLRDFDCCGSDSNIDGGAGSALIALHRDRCDVSNPMWGIFHPPQPVFHFSDLEKDVLEAALHRGTDEEISRMLDLSIWTIKKRWQRVYEKVERII